MHIAVCIKEVSDPDASVTLGEAGDVSLKGIPFVPNPYDEHAIEAAVQLKEDRGAQVTALSVGVLDAERTVIRALAMGADEGILIDIDPETLPEVNGYSTAFLLAAAMQGLAPVDLVVCGREAADTSAGLVGPQLALLLGIPFVTLVTAIEVLDTGLKVHRLAEGGSDVVDCTMPVLLTVSHQINHPRLPSVLKVMQAKRHGIQHWKASDLVHKGSIRGDMRPGYRAIKRYLPTPPGQCQFIGGVDERGTAQSLATKLVERGLF